MANTITSSIPQREHRTIDLDAAFYKASHESPGQYAEIVIGFKKGGNTTWKYTWDQIKDYHTDMKALGAF